MIDPVPEPAVAGAAAALEPERPEAVVLRPIAEDRGVEIFASGMNGALQRLPKLRCHGIPLLAPEASPIHWRPHWPRVKTICLTFPAGLDFLPPPPKACEPHVAELVPVKPPTAVASGE